MEIAKPPVTGVEQVDAITAALRERLAAGGPESPGAEIAAFEAAAQELSSVLGRDATG